MQEVYNKNPVYYILNITRSFYWSIILMFFIATMIAADLSLKTYVLKVILDRLSEPLIENTFTYIGGPILIYLFLSLFMTSLFRFYDYFIQIKMIPKLHNHEYYQNNFSGSLANKINDLSNSVPEIIQIFIDRFFAHILSVIIAIWILWRVRVEFALLMVTWSILFFMVSFFCSSKIQFLAHSWSELGSSITGKIVDTLSNILSVKLFSRQAQERKIFNQTLEKVVKAEQKLQWFYFWMWIFYGYSFVLTQSICLYFLLIGHEEGLISIGDFALVISLNIGIVDILWILTTEFSQFSKLLGRMTQALSTTAAPLDMQDKRGAHDLKVIKGKIVFENVQFFYKNSEPLFEDKSIVISAGQKVGLVGYSGAGKSTFINLILRLFEVQNGRILIDDQDIKNVTQESLHQAITMVPQDPSLFHRTIMENIRYGRLDASDDEVKKAAQSACAHEFILKLPLGYDTLVGERGVKLSGGQRQRISISRAILKNSPILILDEATNQLDSVNEKDIQESLWNLIQDKTTIIVAHRLSTLLNMDRILVFNQGKIVQDGTHNELLGRGLYKTLWDAQISDFLP